MNIYRKTGVRMWGDDKFRHLSPLPPSGQSLWIWLLTGPKTTNLPGLIAGGRAALAEELGWEQEAFDRCFGEIEGLGMARADWKARLIWLPKAVEHNPPANPSIVVAWRRQFDVLPECALKSQAEASIVRFLEQKGPAYAEAFARPSTSAPAPDSPAPTDGATHPATDRPPHGVEHGPEHGVGDDAPHRPGHGVEHRAAHQDQEQDQYQEKDTPRVRAREARPTLVPRRRLHCAFESAIGLDVPHDLHQEFTRKLVNAGKAEADADRELCAWYASTEREWTGKPDIIGDGAYPFWRARFRERHGSTATPVGAGRRAAPAQPRWKPEDENNEWARILVRLEAQLNRHTYLTWFRPTRELRDTGDSIEVVVQEETHRDWLRRHYSEQFATALRDVGRDGTTLVFLTEAEAAQPQAVHA